jgi:ssDNA-binding Zn-finger/Zn-ribbon topoisomerase 1
MKPIITFTCTNEACSANGKEISLTQYSFFESLSEESKDEEYWLARIKYCPKCYRTGEVKIQHGQRVFSNLDAFEEYLAGLAKEAKLLKRLVDSGIANDEEQNQFKKNMDLLSDAKCPCCGNLLIGMIEGEQTSK